MRRARTCVALAGCICVAACGTSHEGAPPPDAGSSVTIDPSIPRIIVSAAAPAPQTTTLGLNYWMWPAAYADDVSGTEEAVAPLAPALLRIGGYNNDANVPMPFDDAALDRAVAYARAVGAEPLLQVPVLADVNGARPTAETAAAMVTFANVTRGYGLRYFSIGNEPDLYATQGAPANMSQPAIAGFTPEDYCKTARDFATAMRAVDASIRIVGPDLSWKYVDGNDWLSPILASCGDVFDIVAFHRYPFSSEAATLEAAEPDAALFAGVVDHVRGLMLAAGQGDKPLALTEVNVVYNATTCDHTASPRTMGSALWLADALATAREKQLYSADVWDISDDESYALGLLGPAPEHAPRPSYYAYELVSGHAGPTHIDVLQTPPHVHAYATRSAAGDETEVLAVNFRTQAVPLAVEVSGLSPTPSPAAFTLPALSITALSLPDKGAARALTYGEAERQLNGVPRELAAGLVDSVDLGPPPLDHPCSATPASCPRANLPDAAVTRLGATEGDALVFGAAPFAWRSYAYAAGGQTVPTAAVTADGNGISIQGAFVPPLTGGTWEGVGLYLDSDYCADVSAYTGVRFDLSGDLGDCTLAFGASFSGDSAANNNPGRGTCAGTGDVCYPPMSVVTPPSKGKTVSVPFASLSGGSPISRFDATTLITIQWQLNAPASGACSADFSIENVTFY